MDQNFKVCWFSKHVEWNRESKREKEAMAIFRWNSRTKTFFADLCLKSEKNFFRISSLFTFFKTWSQKPRQTLWFEGSFLQHTRDLDFTQPTCERRWYGGFLATYPPSLGIWLFSFTFNQSPQRYPANVDREKQRACSHSAELISLF